MPLETTNQETALDELSESASDIAEILTRLLSEMKKKAVVPEPPIVNVSVPNAPVPVVNIAGAIVEPAKVEIIQNPQRPFRKLHFEFTHMYGEIVSADVTIIEP